MVEIREVWRRYLPDYDQRHPERPWWRLVHFGNTAAAAHFGWVRSDGHTVKFQGPPSWWGSPAEMRAQVLANGDEVWAAAVSHDREHPLPCPEPACGQVWWFDWRPAVPLGLAHPDGPMSMERVLVGVRDGFAEWGDRVDLPTMGDWPPMFAHLVGGPGAPWSPAEGGDDE